jgi:predicted RNA binding protein YcfA (HicA-like mRNA interferase family)
MKVRDAIKRLERDGWKLARTKGSHRQYHHPTKPGTVTVAGHPSVDIPPGTLNNILKQAGLKSNTSSSTKHQTRDGAHTLPTCLALALRAKRWTK